LAALVLGFAPGVLLLGPALGAGWPFLAPAWLAARFTEPLPGRRHDLYWAVVRALVTADRGKDAAALSRLSGPARDEAALLRAFSETGRDDYHAALAALDAAPEELASRPEALSARADALARLHRLEEARAVAERIPTDGPDRGFHRRDALARVAAYSGDVATVDRWSAALERSLGTKAALPLQAGLLGRATLEAGQFRTAAYWYAQLARSARRSGDRRSQRLAREAFEQCATRDPEVDHRLLDEEHWAPPRRRLGTATAPAAWSLVALAAISTFFPLSALTAIFADRLAESPWWLALSGVMLASPGYPLRFGLFGTVLLGVMVLALARDAERRLGTARMAALIGSAPAVWMAGVWLTLGPFRVPFPGEVWTAALAALGIAWGVALLKQRGWPRAAGEAGLQLALVGAAVALLVARSAALRGAVAAGAASWLAPVAVIALALLVALAASPRRR
jgi:hypothetical protein